MKLPLLAGCLAATSLLTACTTEDLDAFSTALAAASYDMAYTQPYGTAYAPGYGGSYSPSTFSTYGGWPGGFSYGDRVGYGGCRHTGSFYTCDTNGDGYADMYGNTDTGMYASSSLRVNERGEAFTWGTDCNCWERNRAYDGERREDYRRKKHRRDDYH